MYFLTYEPTPDPIRVAQPFYMTVRVLENTDRATPVKDAALTVQGWMPEHDHGMYTAPIVTSNHDGTYTVRGMLFHMEMQWEIRVDVTRAGVTDRAVFTVACCEQ